MARSFDGATQYYGASKAFTVVPPISFAAWVQNNTAATGDRVVLAFASASGGNGNQVYLRIGDSTANTPEFGYWNTVTNSRAVGASTLTANTWYQLTGTYDGTTYKIYTNGTVATTANSTAPNFSWVSMGLGSNSANAGTTRFWNGLIADIAIWNVALTAAEALALSKGARPYTIRERSLIRYWPLDGLVSTEPDLSGNADNLTPTASPALAFGPPTAPFTPRWQGFFLPPPPSVALWAQSVF